MLMESVQNEETHREKSSHGNSDITLQILRIQPKTDSEETSASFMDMQDTVLSLCDTIRIISKEQIHSKNNGPRIHRLGRKYLSSTITSALMCE